MNVEMMIPGVPQPKGSLTAVRRGTSVFMMSGTAKSYERHKDWWAQVKTYASATMRANGLESPQDGPIAADLTFYLPRPPSAKKRLHCAVKPDLDKLCRGTLDSLVKIVIAEDSRIVSLSARKVYADDENPPGCWARIWSVG